MNTLLQRFALLSLTLLAGACGGSIGEPPRKPAKAEQETSAVALTSDAPPKVPATGLAAVNCTNVGVNFAELSYWSGNMPFVDVMRLAESFFALGPDYKPHPKPLQVDEHGWVRELSPGQTARVYLLGGNWPYPTGRYTVLYEGHGELEYRGNVTNVVRGQGRDSFDLGPGEGGLFIEIPSIDTANPLRNLRVLAPGGSCEGDLTAYCTSDDACGGKRCQPFAETYQEQPFHPSFLAEVQHFGTLRFVGWMESAVVEEVYPPLRPIGDWSKWPTTASMNWHPVPVDVMVDLANTIGAAPWFNIPHNADDAFIRAFAERVKARLRPDLRVYIELSNETWNTIYPAHRWFNAEGCKRLSKNAHAECDPDRDRVLCEPDELQGPQAEPCHRYGRQYFGIRTVETMRLWEEVFGASSKERLVRVFARQIGGSGWWVSEGLEVKLPDGTKVADGIDAVAIAAYFYAPETAKTLDELFAIAPPGTHGAPAGTYVMLSGHPSAQWGGPHRWLQTDLEALKNYPHLRLIAYEGGQHLQSFDPKLRALYSKANGDPRMGKVYTQLQENWNRLTGDSLLVQMAFSATWNEFGSWGIKRYQGEPREQAPKYDALMRYFESDKKRSCQHTASGPPPPVPPRP